jgi:hypothetical protein
MSSHTHANPENGVIDLTLDDNVDVPIFGSASPVRAGGSHAVAGEPLRPRPEVIDLTLEKEPPLESFEYHYDLVRCMHLNGFLHDGIPERIVRILGIRETEHLQWFTIDDITEKCPDDQYGLASKDKFLRLYRQVMAYYQDQP